MEDTEIGTYMLLFPAIETNLYVHTYTAIQIRITIRVCKNTLNKQDGSYVVV